MSNPPPKPNDETPVWDLVVEDMKHRDHVGRSRYGTPLQPFNGRDALQDAYEEALDLAVYLKQAIVEREKGRAVARELKEAGDAFDEARDRRDGFK